MPRWRTRRDARAKGKPDMRRLLRSTALAILFAGPIPFSAPDIFVYASIEDHSDGIPNWIHSACCGPKDVRRLTPEEVHDTGETYVIDGYPDPIPKMLFFDGQWNPNPVVHPSQDGAYWVFYGDFRATGGGVSRVYCFFLPLSF
jgi:hypothetical protein